MGAVKKIIVANWKMNPLAPSEAKQLFRPIRLAALKLNRVQTIICPPAVFLPLFESNSGSHSKKFFLGAQNLFWQKNGAYTGELSAEMLKYAGASFVILGHSESRALGDTEEIVNLKFKAAIRAGLQVVLCVGERERDQEGGYFLGLRRQLETALSGFGKKLTTNLIVAYEPVWAIGKNSDEADTPADFLEKKLFIRKVLAGLLGHKQAHEVSIIYGGSVEPKNAKDFLINGEADGLLVGHSSLRSDHFISILRLAELWKE